MPTATILIVDDEKNILTAVARALRLEGYDADVAGNAEIALRKLDEQSFDAVLLDVQMPGMDGLGLLDELRHRQTGVPVIMMSGHATIDVAMDAIRRGADDFIEKPIGSDRLIVSLERSLQLHRLKKENTEFRRRSGESGPLLGRSEAMERLRSQIELAADSSATVLILGERGTGKELVGAAIHAGSSRTGASFQKLNCAAIPEGLIESELFGHETGAFTGATKRRRGKFEQADGGTLFLDEVGDMPSQMQAKLLRVLQEGEIERVGSSTTIQVDVRVVAATNKSLPTEIEAGRFRADLYDRLNVVPLRVPALRDRTQDIPILAAAFLGLACEAHGRSEKRLKESAMHALQAYSYPGNVRELRNLIERLVILSPNDSISAEDVQGFLALDTPAATPGYFTPETSLRQMMERAEHDLIRRALDFRAGHVTKTAEDLGLERSHLYKKMRSLGIRKPTQSED